MSNDVTQDDFRIEAYGEVILPDDPRHPRNRRAAEATDEATEEN